MSLGDLLQKLDVLAQTCMESEEPQKENGFYDCLHRAAKEFLSGENVPLKTKLQGLMSCLAVFSQVNTNHKDQLRIESADNTVKYLFLECAKLLMCVECASLKKNDPTLSLLRNILKSALEKETDSGYQKYFELLKILTEKPWSSKQLFTVLHDNRLPLKKAAEFVDDVEHPEVILLRIEALILGSCVDLAVRLIDCFVQVKNDDVQSMCQLLILLYKTEQCSEFHRQCTRISCCMACRMLQHMHETELMESHRAAILMMSRTFFLLDWVKTTDLTCTKALLRYWLTLERHHLLGDEKEFVSSFKKVLALAESSAQRVLFVDVLESLFGSRYMEPCLDVALKALQSERHRLNCAHLYLKNKAESRNASMALASVCNILARLFQSHLQMRMTCLLSAACISPCNDNYVSVKKFFELYPEPISLDPVAPSGVDWTMYSTLWESVRCLQPSSVQLCSAWEEINPRLRSHYRKAGWRYDSLAMVFKNNHCKRGIGCGGRILKKHEESLKTVLAKNETNRLKETEQLVRSGKPAGKRKFFGSSAKKAAAGKNVPCVMLKKLPVETGEQQNKAENKRKLRSRKVRAAGKDEEMCTTECEASSVSEDATTCDTVSETVDSTLSSARLSDTLLGDVASDLSSCESRRKKRKSSLDIGTEFRKKLKRCAGACADATVKRSKNNKTTRNFDLDGRKTNLSDAGVGARSASISDAELESRPGSAASVESSGNSEATVLLDQNNLETTETFVEHSAPGSVEGIAGKTAFIPEDEDTIPNDDLGNFLNAEGSVGEENACVNNEKPNFSFNIGSLVQQNEFVSSGLKNNDSENNDLKDDYLENKDLENNGLENNDLKNNDMTNKNLENNYLEHNDLENKDLENIEMVGNGLKNQYMENSNLENNDLENNNLENNDLENSGLENNDLENNDAENNVMKNNDLENNHLEHNDLEDKDLENKNLKNNEMVSNGLKNEDLEKSDVVNNRLEDDDPKTSSSGAVNVLQRVGESFIESSVAADPLTSNMNRSTSEQDETCPILSEIEASSGSVLSEHPSCVEDISVQQNDTVSLQPTVRHLDVGSSQNFDDLSLAQSSSSELTTASNGSSNQTVSDDFVSERTTPCRENHDVSAPSVSATSVNGVVESTSVGVHENCNELKNLNASSSFVVQPKQKQICVCPICHIIFGSRESCKSHLEQVHGKVVQDESQNRQDFASPMPSKSAQLPELDACHGTVANWSFVSGKIPERNVLSEFRFATDFETNAFGKKQKNRENLNECCLDAKQTFSSQSLQSVSNDCLQILGNFVTVNSALQVLDGKQTSRNEMPENAADLSVKRGLSVQNENSASYGIASEETSSARGTNSCVSVSVSNCNKYAETERVLDSKQTSGNETLENAAVLNDQRGVALLNENSMSNSVASEETLSARGTNDNVSISVGNCNEETCETTILSDYAETEELDTDTTEVQEKDVLMSEARSGIRFVENLRLRDCYVRLERLCLAKVKLRPCCVSINRLKCRDGKETNGDGEEDSVTEEPASDDNVSREPLSVASHEITLNGRKTNGLLFHRQVIALCSRCAESSSPFLDSCDSSPIVCRLCQGVFKNCRAFADHDCLKANVNQVKCFPVQPVSLLQQDSAGKPNDPVKPSSSSLLCNVESETTAAASTVGEAGKIESHEQINSNAKIGSAALVAALLSEANDKKARIKKLIQYRNDFLGNKETSKPQLSKPNQDEIEQLTSSDKGSTVSSSYSSVSLKLNNHLRSPDAKSTRRNLFESFGDAIWKSVGSNSDQTEQSFNSRIRDDGRESKSSISAENMPNNGMELGISCTPLAVPAKELSDVSYMTAENSGRSIFSRIERVAVPVLLPVEPAVAVPVNRLASCASSVFEHKISNMPSNNDSDDVCVISSDEEVEVIDLDECSISRKINSTKREAVQNNRVESSGLCHRIVNKSVKNSCFRSKPGTVDFSDSTRFSAFLCEFCKKSFANAKLLSRHKHTKHRQASRTDASLPSSPNGKSVVKPLEKPNNETLLPDAKLKFYSVSKLNLDGVKTKALESAGLVKNMRSGTRKLAEHCDVTSPLDFQLPLSQDSRSSNCVVKSTNMLVISQT